MKCFEIIKELLGKMFEKINRKHEMFWNYHLYTLESMIEEINRKHEMFWNDLLTDNISAFGLLTVNMKCFEISFEHIFLFLNIVLTVNMKCFEIVLQFLL